MIDTHCHLNFHNYDEDRINVIQRALDANVDRVIIPAIDPPTCEESLELAQRYPGIYVAVGIHPNSTADFSEVHLEAIKQYAREDAVIAIGEIGLDYHWDKSPADVQKNAFRAQLALAAELQLPVIIHNRDASEDVMAILEDWQATLTGTLQGQPGVLHSFSAPQAVADRALAAGFYLGFTGPVTFKKADDLRQIAESVPLDRILVETDGPFLTPEPYRGKRNEPAYIPLIVDKLADVKGIAATDMAQITTENAERLFRL